MNRGLKVVLLLGAFVVLLLLLLSAQDRSDEGLGVDTHLAWPA